ncbi:MAG: hypothetical protein D4R56_00910 [Deltaproteobacteria bacterium]|nr:MAG: hypothetical protein D4R56_00910 [Deltaproteobacteria bacterium]
MRPAHCRTIQKDDPVAQTTSTDLDKIWAEEAKKRWAAYKEGRLKAIPYDEVMARYRDRLEEDKKGMKT